MSHAVTIGATDAFNAAASMEALREALKKFYTIMHTISPDVVRLKSSLWGIGDRVGLHPRFKPRAATLLKRLYKRVLS